MEMSDKEIFFTELQNMENKLYEVQEKLDQVDSKLTQVVEALLGNSLTKTGGIVNEIEEMKRRMLALEIKQAKNDDFRKKATWTFTAIVTIFIIVQYVVSIYANLKK
jgi:ribosomal protein S6